MERDEEVIIADFLCLASERNLRNRPSDLCEFFREFDLAVNSEVVTNIVAHVCSAHGFILTDLIDNLLDPTIGFSKSQSINICRLVVQDMITMGQRVDWAPFARLGIDAEHLHLKHEMDHCFLGQFVDNGLVQLIQRVGHGGFAVVYRGIDSDSNSIAVRVPKADEPSAKLFIDVANKECMLRQSLSVEGVPRQYRWFQSEIGPISIGEFVDGKSLDELLKEGIGDTNRCLAIMAEVATIVDNLHTVGVVHRDIKPKNVLISRCGKVFLTDYNTADFGGPTRRATAAAGTAAYMSPEARNPTGTILDTRLDVYSLGAMLYELVAKKKFTSTDNITALFLYLIENGEDYTPEFDVSFSKAIQSLVVIATSMQLDKRFETAGDFAEGCRQAIVEPDCDIHQRSRPMLAAWRLAETLKKCSSIASKMGFGCRDEVRAQEKYAKFSRSGFAELAQLTADMERYAELLAIDIPFDELKSIVAYSEKVEAIGRDFAKHSTESSACQPKELLLAIGRINSVILSKLGEPSLSVYSIAFLINASCSSRDVAVSKAVEAGFPSWLIAGIRYCWGGPKTLVFDRSLAINKTLVINERRKVFCHCILGWLRWGDKGLSFANLEFSRNESLEEDRAWKNHRERLNRMGLGYKSIRIGEPRSSAENPLVLVNIASTIHGIEISAVPLGEKLNASVQDLSLPNWRVLRVLPLMEMELSENWVSISQFEESKHDIMQESNIHR